MRVSRSLILFVRSIVGMGAATAATITVEIELVVAVRVVRITTLTVTVGPFGLLGTTLGAGLKGGLDGCGRVEMVGRRLRWRGE